MTTPAAGNTPPEKVPAAEGSPAQEPPAAEAAPAPPRAARAARRARKQVLLRLDPLVHDALARWAGDELRSANAQIEFLLRRALSDAGRLPRDTGPLPRRGRPPGGAARPAAEADEDD
ncbi:hypothetical protein [Streptomyces sp. NPDC008150]|uniref:hypothetical protein n=1 Tax=Streptomyces sp. NPDC008150 TaxID=3364816 RepID=UPI0036E5C493